MTIISLVTPAYQPRPDFLLEAFRSVECQEIESGTLEWLIQEDGPESDTSFIPDRPWIKRVQNRHMGVALTRNMALARASGKYVKNLDQDDILTPGAIARDIQALESTSAQWCTSRVLDLLPNGETVGFDNDPPGGIIKPGSVIRHWEAHDYILPVHPTTVCMERDLAVLLGGWMAIPGSDDTGLLLSASAISDGYFIPDVGLLYRKWEGQVTATPEHWQVYEREMRMSLASERAHMLLAQRGINL